MLETDSSVIILGDINPGAEVVSSGNIVILGTLYGYARAGKDNNRSCFIVALEMKPTGIAIGDLENKDGIKGAIFKNKQARIAYVEEETIKVETITTALLNRLQV